MTQLSFHNQNNTRRAFLTGLGACSCGVLLSSPVSAMASRVHRPFVDEQVEVIRGIVEEREYIAALSNRYLASGIYYSSTFLTRLAHPANQVDVPTAIIGRVSPLLTGSYRLATVTYFEEMVGACTTCDRRILGEQESLPLRQFSFGHGINHADAVDLFAREGSTVHAFASGIVLVADAGWSPGDERSAASMRGGNTVIVFSHTKNEFYRYAHLRTVMVTPGQIVLAGTQLGTVGNTGTNAMRPGHGGHLHFEINRHSRQTGENVAVQAAEIRRRLSRLL